MSLLAPGTRVRTNRPIVARLPDDVPGCNPRMTTLPEKSIGTVVAAYPTGVVKIEVPGFIWIGASREMLDVIAAEKKPIKTVVPDDKPISLKGSQGGRIQMKTPNESAKPAKGKK